MNRRQAMLGAFGGLAALAAFESANSSAELGAAEGVAANEIIDNIAKVRQATSFSGDLGKDEIVKIVSFGATALSHRNKQPWFVSVLTDKPTLKAIDDAAELDSSKRLSFGGASAAVIVSAGDDDSDYEHFAIGALVERMIVAAALLGVQCKTVIAGLKVVGEGEFREKLGVPEGMTPYVALLLGREENPTVDGVSGATSRALGENKIKYVPAL